MSTADYLHGIEIYFSTEHSREMVSKSIGFIGVIGTMVNETLVINSPSLFLKRGDSAKSVS